MSAEIKKLEPTIVWNNFYELTQIPRPSKHEERVIKYMVDFGKRLGLESFTDETGNVIIRKPATPGYEGKKGIVLQAHLDMVPQKNNDTEHDFQNDPIDAYVDGEWVRARGTTLGADNGMGVAAAMAILEDDTLKHGPIECLFTYDEEEGMTGASKLKPGVLQGEILLNLDSETEGELYVGCAGGEDAIMTFPIQREELHKDHECACINIKGLLGGHSGMDIILGRGNSVKMLFRILNHLREFDPQIIEIEGGSLRNAIPREASCKVALPTEKVGDFIKGVEALYKEIAKELALADKGVKVLADRCNAHGRPMTKEASRKLIDTFVALPNGVVRMSNAMDGLCETSLNLATVKSEQDCVKAAYLMRSSVESAKKALAEKVGACVRLGGGSVEYKGGYPGWNPNMESPILKAMQETYKREFGKTPKIMAIHAGLECGILGGPYPEMDMISFGPTILSPHSPDERVNIKSVGEFYRFLVEVLANSPEKKG